MPTDKGYCSTHSSSISVVERRIERHWPSDGAVEGQLFAFSHKSCGVTDGVMIF